MGRISIFVAACGILWCAGVGKSADAVAPSSGQKMCSALTVADFTKAGVPVLSFAGGSTNPDDDTGAYCGYNIKNGKVEFDIFYPAGDTPQQAQGVERTVLGDGFEGKSETVHINGTDSAEINLAIPGKPPSAGIAVRRKTAVFAIYIPTDPKARQQLLSLTQAVLGRLQP